MQNEIIRRSEFTRARQHDSADKPASATTAWPKLHRLRAAALAAVAVVMALAVAPAAEPATRVAFPDTQPKNGNFNRPLPGQALDVSPPGFCWWRAGPRDEVSYRLTIADASGQPVYRSAILRDPVDVPDRVLPAGAYTWTVDAVSKAGAVLATRPAQPFSIVPAARPLPWVAPQTLLARVPPEHPRLLFPKAGLPAVRATLGTTRRAAFEELRQHAESALALPLMKKPDFDKFDIKKEYPARRTAYRAAYLEFTRIYLDGMTPMALRYLLTGETPYGERAKAHLLNLLDWETTGIASLDEGFDEIGLRIAHTAAQAYDWLYPLLTDRERAAVRAMLIDHGNKMLQRLQRRDYLHTSALSHDGRLPGFLVEFSIALAEEPVAREWMDYAMRTLLTVFPHWGDSDGGWAEGINYYLSYNERFITPLHSLLAATGYDLWQMAYFRTMRYFPFYCMAPRGEVTPFGDSEHIPAEDRAGETRAILQYHALRYRDPVTRWWINQEPMAGASFGRAGPQLRIILADDLAPVPPSADIPLDRAFRGIGWAAFHTDLVRPERDVMVLFKSSPFGAVSHSHADQNSFVIMKGGKALAIPGGERYPQHGSPFHTRYTQHTLAHNCLLIDDRGQVNQDGRFAGRLTGFTSLPHVAHVSGEAAASYGQPVERYTRHVVLIRPSLIVVVDDLEASKDVGIKWLMHAKEPLALDQASQAFASHRAGERMHVQLFGAGGFDLAQTDAWPLAPKTDYPMVTAPDPAPQWHFTATARQRAPAARLAAVMRIADRDVYPDYHVERSGDDVLRVTGKVGGDAFSVEIDLNPARASQRPIIQVNYRSPNAPAEQIRVE